MHHNPGNLYVPTIMQSILSYSDAMLRFECVNTYHGTLVHSIRLRSLVLGLHRVRRDLLSSLYPSESTQIRTCFDISSVIFLGVGTQIVYSKM